MTAKDVFVYSVVPVIQNLRDEVALGFPDPNTLRTLNSLLVRSLNVYEKNFKTEQEKKMSITTVVDCPGGKVTSHHFTDDQGRPTGGITSGTGFTISWQNGPLGRGEERQPPNGAFVENVLLAVVDRLNFYQRSPFNSPYNHLALEHLGKALDALRARTQSREDRGVEGTWET